VQQAALHGGEQWLGLFWLLRILYLLLRSALALPVLRNHLVTLSQVLHELRKDLVRVEHSILLPGVQVGGESADRL